MARDRDLRFTGAPGIACGEGTRSFTSARCLLLAASVKLFERLASLLLALVIGLAQAPPSAAAEHADGVWRWQRTPITTRGRPPTALAFDPSSDRIAVGDPGGVSLAQGGGPFGRAARVEGVRDLHFGTNGELWIASVSGLWRLDREDRLEQRSPGAGELARWAERVRSVAGLIAVATAAGVFASDDGRAWSRPGDGAPVGPVRALDLRPIPGKPAEAELWFVVDRDLWRGRVARRAGALRIDEVKRLRILGRPTGAAPVDLLVNLPNREVALLFPKHLALGADGAGASDPDWRVLPLALPPGASARRLAVAGDRRWLLTDRGLLEAASFDGVWRRAGVPVGSSPAAALIGTGHAVWAATEQGLFQGRAQIPAVFQPRVRELPADPDILSVQRAALRYLGLRPERMRALERGLSRRGWLPSLSLRFGVERGRDRSEDWDQAYVSGDKRFLYDRDKDKSREYEASAALSWELGDLAYDPEVVELSRESRQVIALRDDMLDEINQLYFERRRVLRSLASLPAEAAPETDSEREKLRIRAAELAAGLDAWTGGWFSDPARR